MRDRSSYRRELQAAIRDQAEHLANLRRELEKVEDNYVQVKFIEGYNEFTSPSDTLYTYRDPSGRLCEGDIVLAGFKNALARVVSLGPGSYDGIVKDIQVRLVTERL